jgi:hypothetical protein
MAVKKILSQQDLNSRIFHLVAEMIVGVTTEKSITLPDPATNSNVNSLDYVHSSESLCEFGVLGRGDITS